MASLSNLRADLSRLKPAAQTAPNHDDEIDGLEVNSATNTGNDSASEIGATSKITPLGSNLDPSIVETGNVKAFCA